MFALEVTFADGATSSEVVFVQRPKALIGATDYSHVVIDDLKDLQYQLQISRDVGRKFRCRPIGVSESVQVPEMLHGTYEGSVNLDLGKVKLSITSIDTDLLMRDAEPPDKAGVRVMRQAVSTTSPEFPAIVVGGTDPIVFSFAPDQTVYVGRSRDCALRVESAGVSAKHARIGYESGEFWVEDLGSTNGTFVNQQQISGRVNVEPGSPIMLGKEVAVMGVVSQSQILEAENIGGQAAQAPAVAERRYPVLFSLSEVARPARMLIPTGTARIGRDPNSDMWIGAPHISRSHVVVELTKRGEVLLTDESTNGTALNGKLLKRAVPFDIEGTPGVLDFGSGVTVAVCFDDEQEQKFREMNGDALVFSNAGPGIGSEKRSHKAKLPRSGSIGKKAGRETPVSFLIRAFRSFSIGGKAFLILMGILFVFVIFGITVLLKGVFS